MEEKGGESLDLNDIAPWLVKRKYVDTFAVPADPWRIDASWEDAYFESARRIVDGVVKGELNEAIEGIAGVFMFRHYLELALKYIIINARWLKDASTNAERAEVQQIGHTHDLDFLWNTMIKACSGKIDATVWKGYDVPFAQKMVREFHNIDRRGFGFRYHGDKFGPDPGPAAPPVLNQLYIRFVALLETMQHARDVLWAINNLLVETYGQNAEWAGEVESW